MIISNDSSVCKKEHDKLAEKYVDLVSWLVENHLEVLQEYNTQKHGGE